MENYTIGAKTGTAQMADPILTGDDAAEFGIARVIGPILLHRVHILGVVVKYDLHLTVVVQITHSGVATDGTIGDIRETSDVVSCMVVEFELASG